MSDEIRVLGVSGEPLALNKPEVVVRNAPTLFDAEGKLTEEPTRKVVRDMLVAFARLALAASS